MKIVLAFLLIAAVCVFAEETASSDVVTLTDSTFDSSTANGKWLLEFYAPWCGHCKKLAPIYEKVATELKGKVNVGKVDCTVEKDVCSRFGVRGYPTVKFVEGDKLYEYKSARTVDDFVAYANGGYTSAASAAVPAKAVVEAVKETVKEVAQEAGKEAAAAAGAVKQAVENVIPKAGEAVKAAAAEIPKAAEAVKAAVTEGAATDAPSDVVVLTTRNFDDLTAKGDWLLEFYAPWCGHCKRLTPNFDAASVELKGKVNLGKVDCTTEQIVCKRFAIRSYPTLKFLHEGRLTEFQGERSVEGIKNFSLTGWSALESVAAPPVPTKWEITFEEYKLIFKQVEQELRDKIWAAFGVVLVIGILVGRYVLGGRSSSPSTSTTTTAPRRKAE